MNVQATNKRWHNVIDSVTMRHSMDAKSQDLRHFSVFEPCSDEQLQAVAARTTELSVPAGRVLMREGDLGQECFLVAEGQVSVEREGHQIALLGPGSVVGEMAIIGREPRSATVTTLTPLRCYVLTPSELSGVLDIEPVASEITKTMSSR